MQLVEKMIAQDPKERPTAKDILGQLKELEKNDKKQFLFKNSPKTKPSVRDRSL